MRIFVTLCTLMALGQAKPQQGYNYGTGLSGTLTHTQSSQGGGFLSAPSNTQSSVAYGPLGAFQSASVGSLVGSSGGGGGGGYSSGGSNYVSGSSSSNFGGGRTASSNYGGSSGGFTGFGPTPNIGFGALSGYQAPSYQQQQEQEVQRGFQEPIIHKQFFTVAAPEEHENLERAKHLVIGRPQKNYRVVFIKAPSSSNANVKLSAEYAPKEEKTVIYVLSKKDNQLEVNDIATPAPTVPSKPEVFFIKYKTEAEASHAQQQIQAEYDRIEGTSEHSDGGVAPAQSVVGILDGGALGSASSGSSQYAAGGGSSSGGSAGGYTSSTGGSAVGSIGGYTTTVSGGSSGGHNNAQSATYLPPSGK
ncbi:keratin, type I cytoskeletal 10 [Drosophila pseudoobscura]|uniref:Keratin, type I cytoskeletal 10 n=1 Tax=Drosophila pseudoobscura pseudoobscura TaxID=46245 RepID=A0A6I8WCV8_DROPS|nr:keratin, type I cytoskeletal 10 [Drosophila pseudoobscura]